MVKKQLIRKKSEHNELIIHTLEELSLHQENIEKIELVQDWCRDLQILLLQGNLIPRIENLWKLKKLNYLNLAINNIERVENLEKLESLSKLDLTLNFIGDLESLSSLRGNYNLRELILTGNPCTDFPGYRTFVVHQLPQLEILDSTPVTKSEKLTAALEFPGVLPGIITAQEKYKVFRKEQKVRVNRKIQEIRFEMSQIPDEEQRNKFFWDSKCEHSPESRIDLAHQQMENEKRKERSSDEKVKKKPPRRLFTDKEEPLNVNEAKLEFLFRDLLDSFELELFIPKFCCTESLTVDVQPTYVRTTMKGQIFQLALKEEVRFEESTSQRSQTTGHLVIRMPKINYDAVLVAKEKEMLLKAQQDKKKFTKDIKYKEGGDYGGSAVDSGAATDGAAIVVDASEVPPLI